MKYSLLFVAVLAAAAVVLAIAYYPARQPPTVQVYSQGPTVERLSRLMHLVTTRVYVADVLTGEGAGYRGVWLIRGDALIGVDLSRAEIVEKDLAARRATVSLPPPAVMQARVDHERTMTWEVRKTTWIPWSGDGDFLRDTVMRQAQRLVAAAACSAENVAQSRAAAEAIIRGFYEEVGWQVRIEWRDGRRSSSGGSRHSPDPSRPPDRPAEAAFLPAPPNARRRPVARSCKL